MRVMRTLFAKLFAWFWITIALLLCVTFAGSWLLARDPRTVDHHVGDPFGIVVRIAQDVYVKHGRAELDSMLAGIERRDSVTPYLVAGGRELRGRPMPDAVARVASQVTMNDAPTFWPHPPRILFGYPLHGVAGERLALVLSPKPLPGPLRVLMPISAGGPWMLALLVVLTGVICLALVQVLVAPVRRLQEATKRLAAGELNARTGYAGHVPGDELEALALDFDRMAERIELLVGSQRQLLRDISHELRSPLTRMGVAIGLARKRVDANAQPLLDRIERESERLNELISQLLMLTRLEDRDAPARWERIDLVEVVDALVDDAHFEAQPDERLVQRTGDRSVVVMARADLIRSAIENVLRNALRYTAQGGRVEVRVLELHDPSQAQVIVRDYGPGVPPGQLEAIFRAFHRVQDARDRASGGMGLGLAIAQRAVAAHGGSIVARNAAGGGLEIDIRLPFGHVGVAHVE